MAFEDRDLTCVECSQTFVFTADDQQYHADKAYTNEPKRCPNCRQARRAGRGYDSGFGGGGGGGGGGFGGGGGGGGMRREMHPAVCAECGKDTEVPFRPRGDRPVYCSDCYSKQRDSRSHRY